MTTTASEAVSVYCLKCKSHKEVNGGEQVTLKNGSPALQGRCPDCNTLCTKFLKRPKSDE